MGIFNRFPYSSTHEMNLDFMLGKAQEINQQLQTVQTGMQEVQTGLSQISEQTERATTAAAAAEAARDESQQNERDAFAWTEQAEQHADRAEAALSQMTDDADRAEAAADRAEAAASAASISASAASNSADIASQNSATAAQQAANAELAAQNAANALNRATVSANNAQNSAVSAADAAALASGYNSQAATSATNAATSATNAATSAASVLGVEQNVQDLVESIPEDYSTLSNDVNDLKSAFAPVVTEVDNLREDVNDVMVMPSYGESLDYKRLDQIIISTTNRNLYPAGSQGISETYAFDVTGVTTPVTIVVKDNNTIALAYSDVPMASINSGDAVTPLYAYTLINGEITVPAHVFNEHSTLLVSPTYKAAKRSLCKCVKGTTDSYKRRPPIISFIDDDGMDEALDNWEALGNSLGIRNSFAIITGSVGQGNYANWEKIQRLSGEGFEFVSHTHGHQNVTTLTDEAINADSKMSREAMIAHGLPYNFMAYPGGYIDAAHYAIIQKNYMAGIAGGGSALNVPPLNPINIVRSSMVSGTKEITVDGNTYTVNAPKTIDAVKNEFDALIMRRGWIIFTSHFRNSYTDGYYYNSDFSTLVEDIVKYAQANGVAIKSFSKGFEMFNNRLAVGFKDDASYYIVDCDGIVHER